MVVNVERITIKQEELGPHTHEPHVAHELAHLRHKSGMNISDAHPCSGYCKFYGTIRAGTFKICLTNFQHDIRYVRIFRTRLGVFHHPIDVCIECGDFQVTTTGPRVLKDDIQRLQQPTILSSHPLPDNTFASPRIPRSSTLDRPTLSPSNCSSLT